MPTPHQIVWIQTTSCENKIIVQKVTTKVCEIKNFIQTNFTDIQNYSKCVCNMLLFLLQSVPLILY